ncbi:hypothetical protein TWF718_009667 [Orbilia javanica]|uniref:Uncharacterized protein n=1 Tax=Orbilia javanica TaxID=47235 RepID=A0AAN8MU33_9PEZI
MFTLLYRAIFHPPSANSSVGDKDIYWLQFYHNYEQWYQGVAAAILSVDSGIPIPLNYSLDSLKVPSERFVVFAKILQNNEPPLQISDDISYDLFISRLQSELLNIDDPTVYFYKNRSTKDSANQHHNSS